MGIEWEVEKKVKDIYAIIEISDKNDGALMSSRSVSMKKKAQVQIVEVRHENHGYWTNSRRRNAYEKDGGWTNSRSVFIKKYIRK